jgi:tetratricopeptide (TPR) repeat protein
MKKFFQLYKKISALLTNGITISLCCFIFENLRDFLKQYNLPDWFAWIIPSIIAFAVFVFVLSIYTVCIVYRDRAQFLPPLDAFSDAILRLAKQLNKEGRDKPLVDLRNRTSHTLHIFGCHIIREELGKLALQSAAVIGDNETKVEVLCDDLGWCLFMQGKKEQAIFNIKQAINFADKILDYTNIDFVRVNLFKAKALRHLATIYSTSNSDNIKESDILLDNACSIVMKLDEKDIRVATDMAQILFCKAQNVALRYSVSEKGFIRKTDKEALNAIYEAIDFLTKAEKRFSDIGDIDRRVKALSLHVRLLESINDENQYLEVIALKERAIAMSQWLNTNNIIKVSHLKGV